MKAKFEAVIENVKTVKTGGGHIILYVDESEYEAFLTAAAMHLRRVMVELATEEKTA